MAPIKRWRHVRNVVGATKKSRMPIAWPLKYSLLPIPTTIPLFRFGNATSPTLSRIRLSDLTPILAMGDRIMAPPYSGWEKMATKPGISTFSKPVFTSGYVWRLNVQSSPEDVHIVRDILYRIHTPHVQFVDHLAWLPKKDMLLTEFIKALEGNQKRTSIDETDEPNTWVRLPKSAILPKSILTPVSETDDAWMGTIHAAIAHALYNKIESMERRSKELSELGEPDEMLFLDEDVLVLKDYYSSFLRDCVEMYERKAPSRLMLPLMMRPGQVPVRFYSTTTRVTAIPVPPMVMEVIRERIMELEASLEDANDIESMLDIEHVVRGLNDVVHRGFVGIL